MSKFSAFFHDSHTLKNLVAVLNREQVKIPFKVSPSGILISLGNKTECALFYATLDARELSEYYYSAVDESGEELPSISFTVDSKEMNKAVKSLNKKDSVVLSLDTERGKLSISLRVSSNTPTTSTSLVDVEYQNTETEYGLPEYDEVENLRVPMKEFTRLCNKMGVLGCTSVEILGYEAGSIFNGLKTEQSIMSIDQLGRCSEQEEHISQLRIPIFTIRTLAKLNSLSPNGIVKLFFSRDLPMKLECQIGSYGTLQLALRGKKN